MPFKLRDLLLDRVDLVGAGANPGANIMLFKSEEEREDDVPQPRKKATKKVAKDDTRKKKVAKGEDDDEDEEDDHASRRRVSKGNEEEDDEEETDEDAEETDDEEEEEAPRKKTKKTLKKKKPVKKAKADEDEDEDEDDDADVDEDEEDARVAKGGDEDDEDDDEDEEVEEIPEKVLKSLPESVRKNIERNATVARQARKDAKQAMRLATVEKTKRERAEFIAKAKKDIPNLTGTDEEKGELLQALFSGEAVSPDVAKRIVKLLKTGDVAIKSMMMSETGSRARRDRGDDADDPVTQLREAGEEIRKSKSGKELTKEQAFEKACDENPELFQQYLKERKRSRRRELDID